MYRSKFFYTNTERHSPINSSCRTIKERQSGTNFRPGNLHQVRDTGVEWMTSRRTMTVFDPGSV